MTTDLKTAKANQTTKFALGLRTRLSPSVPLQIYKIAIKFELKTAVTHVKIKTFKHSLIKSAESIYFKF